MRTSKLLNLAVLVVRVTFSLPSESSDQLNSCHPRLDALEIFSHRRQALGRPCCTCHGCDSGSKRLWGYAAIFEHGVNGVFQDEIGGFEKRAIGGKTAQLSPRDQVQEKCNNAMPRREAKQLPKGDSIQDSCIAIIRNPRILHQPSPPTILLKPP